MILYIIRQTLLLKFMVGDFLMGSFPVRGSYSIIILEKILIVRSAYQVRKILSIWYLCVIEQSQYGNPCHNLDSTQAYEVAHMMIEWPPTYKQLLFFCHLSYPLCLGSSCCFFLHLFLSMFGKQLLLFLPNLPSPLLSFVLSMMKLSKSIHYMEYELMIKNLWGTWHH